MKLQQMIDTCKKHAEEVQSNSRTYGRYVADEFEKKVAEILDGIFEHLDDFENVSISVRGWFPMLEIEVVLKTRCIEDKWNEPLRITDNHLVNWDAREVRLWLMEALRLDGFPLKVIDDVVVVEISREILRALLFEATD